MVIFIKSGMLPIGEEDNSRQHICFKEDLLMRIAGGIVAIIAGIFNTCISLLLLVPAGILYISNEGKYWGLVSTELVYREFLDILFSFLVITLGAIAVFVKSKITGILLILFLITYAFLGNIIKANFVESVANFPLQIFPVIRLLLGVIGGILIIIGTKTRKALPVISETEQAVQGNKP